MRSPFRAALAGLVTAAALMLSSCADKTPERVASTPYKYRPTEQQAYAPAPANAGASSESLWRLRAGLNVAALSCRGRGRPSVVGAYSQLLNRHKAALAAAYQAEQRRYGVAGFDRYQTRLYNRYANQRSPQAFCQTAVSVAGRANALDSARLGPAAPRLVAELERPLR